MNYKLLSKILGSLLILVSGAMGSCLAYAFGIDEHGPGIDAVDGFAISVMLTLFSGALLFMVGRRTSMEILRKEAIAIVGLGWIVSGLFGAIPYMVMEPHLSFSGAVFESISGFTTTGSTVIEDLNKFPRSLLLWRSLTQWLGGLGILVLFVALLSYLGVGSKALFRHESSAKSSQGLQARIHDVAFRMWLIYFLLSAFCFGGLMFLGMDFYDAVNHAMTAISTGGFSPYNQSVAYYDDLAIELWLVLFMILGGISFMLYAWLLRGVWQKWKNDEEAKLFLIIIAVTTVVVGAYLAWLEYPMERAFRDSLFQIVSVITTTGYATADFDLWPAFPKMLLVFLMFVGGCAGSTAGGIKVSRWLLFFKVIRLEVIAAFRPNQVIAVKLNGDLTDQELRMQTVFFVAMAGVIMAMATGLVSFLEPTLDIDSSLTAVAATLFNIGPGLGAVGPTQNFAAFSEGTLVFLSVLMLLGRLEFFAILVLFSPTLWKKY